MTDLGSTARSAGRSQTARRVVLVGWAAKGVVYVTLAWLVLQSAFGRATQESSTTGALQAVAATGAGTAALVVLGLGLLAYAVGRVLEVTVLATGEVEAKDKVQGLVLAGVYVVLAVTAFGIAGLVDRSGGGSSGGSKEQQGSAFLLGLPGGRYLVGAIGLAVVAVGVYEMAQGVRQKFLGTLRTGQMSSGLRSATKAIGTTAYLTKGAIFVLLGVFFVRSAVQYDPREAKGLDSALAEVAQASYGQVLLTLVALGLLAYGVFAFLESRYRRVGSSATGTT